MAGGRLVDYLPLQQPAPIEVSAMLDILLVRLSPCRPVTRWSMHDAMLLRWRYLGDIVRTPVPIETYLDGPTTLHVLPLRYVVDIDDRWSGRPIYTVWVCQTGSDADGIITGIQRRLSARSL